MRRTQDIEMALRRMHLQWFAEDDEEVDPPIEGAVDEVEDEDDFQILVEGRDEIPPEEEEVPREEGPSREELLSELASLRARQELTTSQLGDRETLERGFDRLSQVLSSQQGASQQGTGPQETWDDVKKRLSKDFYNDPMSALEEALKFAIRTEVAPAFHQTQELVSKTALTASRQAAEANPSNKTILDRYRKEVEEEVGRLPGGPDVYERACQTVGMRHFDELIEARLEAALAEKGSDRGARPRPTSNVSPTGVGSRATTKKTPRRVLTIKQREAADAAGISYEAAWDYFNS